MQPLQKHWRLPRLRGHCPSAAPSSAGWASFIVPNRGRGGDLTALPYAFLCLAMKCCFSCNLQSPAGGGAHLPGAAEKACEKEAKEALCATVVCHKTLGAR